MKLTKSQLKQIIKEEVSAMVEADGESQIDYYRRIYGTRGTEADKGEWVIRNTGAGSQYYIGRIGREPTFKEPAEKSEDLAEDIRQDEDIIVYKLKSKANEKKEMIEMDGLQVEVENLAEMGSLEPSAEGEVEGEMEKQLPPHVQAKKIYADLVELRRHIKFKNEDGARIYYDLQKSIDNLQRELVIATSPTTPGSANNP